MYEETIGDILDGYRRRPSRRKGRGGRGADTAGRVVTHIYRRGPAAV
jgi:hypothetical protein